MASLKSVGGTVVLLILAGMLAGCGNSARDFEEAKERFQALAVTKEKKIKKYLEDRGSESVNFQVMEVYKETDTGWKGVHPYAGHMSITFFQTKGKDPLKYTVHYHYRLADKTWVQFGASTEGEEIWPPDKALVKNDLELQNVFDTHFPD